MFLSRFWGNFVSRQKEGRKKISILRSAIVSISQLKKIKFDFTNFDAQASLTLKTAPSICISRLERILGKCHCRPLHWIGSY